jgi:hypothetical protein
MINGIYVNAEVKHQIGLLSITAETKALDKNVNRAVSRALHNGKLKTSYRNGSPRRAYQKKGPSENISNIDPGRNVLDS